MTSSGIEETRPPLRFTRASEGRVLGGVCAGLPSLWGLSVTGRRALFVLAGLCGGIGVVAYVAGWLIMPIVDTEPDAEATPAVVLLAGASGAVVVLMLAAGMSAIATVFGLGWVMLAIAAVVFVLTLGPLARRIPASLALLTVAVLTIPSMVVALTPLRVDLQDGPKLSAPASTAALESQSYHSGFGTQFIDLRGTPLPQTGTVTVHINAGLRRTIVALPDDRCVKVRVNYAVHPFASQLATLLSGDTQPAFHGVVLFGSVFGATSAHLSGHVFDGGTSAGPTLDIDFSSQGGSLYVRDYPHDVSPQIDPNWPGFAGAPEVAPNLAGDSHKAAVQIVRQYKQRRAADIASETRIRQLMGGPCAN
jgi:phage shock protein PspC (stress-responsive transcriptional regulator)